MESAGRAAAASGGGGTPGRCSASGGGARRRGPRHAARAGKGEGAGRREKKGERKWKKEKEKKGGKEKEKKRVAPAGFEAMVSHARAAAFGRSATVASGFGGKRRARRTKKGERDRTAIGTGVGMADCQKKISGDRKLGRKRLRNDLSSTLKRILKFIFSE